jgi:5-methyltetrahydrofolate--homocysteine methyltransferase
MVRGEDYDGILTLAKKLVNEGSHMLDLCCAIVGEDEKATSRNILEKIATRVPAPITDRLHRGRRDRGGAEAHSGQAIINSINLGRRREAHLESAAHGARYGAAVIALTIDEDGMALTADRRSGHRQAHLRSGGEKVRHSPVRLDLRRADAADLDRPGRLPHRRHRDAESGEGDQEELPEVKTILGVSNISFGLNVYARRVLNSVFMHEAVDHGLDMAIVNYSKIYPLYKIPEAKLIWRAS